MDFPASSPSSKTPSGCHGCGTASWSHCIQGRLRLGWPSRQPCAKDVSWAPGTRRLHRARVKVNSKHKYFLIGAQFKGTILQLEPYSAIQIMIDQQTYFDTKQFQVIQVRSSVHHASGTVCGLVHFKDSVSPGANDLLADQWYQLDVSAVGSQQEKQLLANVSGSPSKKQQLKTIILYTIWD